MSVIDFYTFFDVQKYDFILNFQKKYYFFITSIFLISEISRQLMLVRLVGYATFMRSSTE